MNLRCLARLTVCVTALALAGGHAVARDQGYPSKAIKLVVPYSPGGPVDVLSRLVGQKLSERLGQPVVIENNAGGSTSIGTNLVAKAPADGYTLMMGTVSSHAMNPAIAKGLPFDPIADFSPISMVASMPFLLVVNPSTGISSVKDLIALAKSSKGNLTYGSAGPGTSNHFAGELFKAMAGVDLIHVPYKGMAPAEIDLMGGRLTMMFDTTITAMPQIDKGLMKAIAITTAERAPFAPGLPTVGESGVPGFAVEVWFGLFAPARTAPEIVQKLNAQVREIMKAPDVAERLKTLGGLPRTDTPPEFTAFVNSEAKKWAEIARDAKITVN